MTKDCLGGAAVFVLLWICTTSAPTTIPNLSETQLSDMIRQWGPATRLTGWPTCAYSMSVRCDWTLVVYLERELVWVRGWAPLLSLSLPRCCRLCAPTSPPLAVSCCLIVCSSCSLTSSCWLFLSRSVSRERILWNDQDRKTMFNFSEK